MKDIQKMYSNKEYCLEELRRARELMGLKSTTTEQRDSLGNSLAFMYLYCPLELEDSIEATMKENNIRQRFLDLGF